MDILHWGVRACPSPISEQEAAAILATYRGSDTLLPNLRYWISILKVSEIVIGGVRKDTERLATEVKAAQSD